MDQFNKFVPLSSFRKQPDPINAQQCRIMFKKAVYNTNPKNQFCLSLAGVPRRPRKTQQIAICKEDVSTYNSKPKRTLNTH